MAHISPEKLTEVCRLLKQGNEDAMRQLFLETQPKIFNYLLRFTGNREVAEDLTQESFINFWLSLYRIESDHSCVAYLFTIARHHALNHIQRTVRTVPIDEEHQVFLNGKCANAENSEVYLIDDYQKAIDSLPKRCKETFLLSRFSDLQYSEIAVIMGVSVQTVKNQMNKAISLLRIDLKKYSE